MLQNIIYLFNTSGQTSGHSLPKCCIFCFVSGTQGITSQASYEKEIFGSLFEKVQNVLYFVKQCFAKWPNGSTFCYVANIACSFGQGVTIVELLWISNFYLFSKDVSAYLQLQLEINNSKGVILK